MKLHARALLSIAILSSILSGCAILTRLNEPPKPTYDPVPAMCEIFVPIKWNKADTDETLKQIKAHNGVWLQLCGPIKRPAQSAFPNMG